MAIDLRPDGTIHVPELNAPINQTHLRVAEIIADYSDELELHFIPPGKRSQIDTKPWAVVHRPPNGKPYYVFFAEDADERLLAKLFSIDNKDKNVFAEMEKLNQAREMIMLKQEMEERQEAHELAASIIRSRKIHYKHNGIDYGELRQ